MANLQSSEWLGVDVRAPKKPLTPEQLDAFRPKRGGCMATITNEQRALNKELRLRHAASAVVGITVRFLKTCDKGVAGTTGVVATSHAEQLIANGTAESAE
jgi:hypothetical protein